MDSVLGTADGWCADRVGSRTRPICSDVPEALRDRPLGQGRVSGPPAGGKGGALRNQLRKVGMRTVVISPEQNATLAADPQASPCLILQPEIVTCGVTGVDAERPPLDDHGL